MVKVQKTVGERPAKVVVLSETVEFDREGLAEVSEAVAKVLSGIPTEYRLVDEETTSEVQDSEPEKEEAVEEEAEEEVVEEKAPVKTTKPKATTKRTVPASAKKTTK